jgi:hypothetical protein
MMQPHPGFKAVQKNIQGEGYSKKTAGAILAAATRKASPAAKSKNPRLRKVTLPKAKKSAVASRMLKSRLGQ